MANYISNVCFIFAFSFLMATLPIRGAYAESPPDAEVTVVNWDAMAGAKTYNVAIAKDRMMTQIIAQAEVSSSKTQFQAKDLAAGTYYVVVKGLSGSKEIVGITAPIPLVVGATFTITGKRFGLPPPHLLDPPADGRLPPEIKVRFVWSRVPEANRYRFRIWKENEDKKEFQLLWQTETDRNYIELTDVPPTSYRYFHEGKYRWQVACLTGPKGEQAFEGDDAQAEFTVTKDVLLEKLNDDGDLAVTLGLGTFQYSGTSGVTTNVIKLNGTAARLGLDIRTWFSTHKGMFISGNLTTIRSDNVKGVLKSISGEYMMRTQISNTSSGWGMSEGWSVLGGIGLGLRQDLQVDDISKKSFPLSMGLRWRLGFVKTLSDHWNSEILFSGLFAMITYQGGGNSDPIHQTIPQALSVDGNFQFGYALNPTTRLKFGLLAYHYRSQYEQVLTHTTNTLLGLSGITSLSFVF